LEFWISYGLDKYNDFLRDEDECRPFNGTRTLEDMKAGGSTSVPKILIIVFGICLLLINLCAYVALFKQRRRLKAQEKLMERLHADLEITTTLVPSELVRRKDKSKKMQQRNGEGRYDAVGTTAEGIERDDSVQNGWKVSRQCSASTMDTHAKIRWWFESEQKQRSSPEILQLTQFDPADQKHNQSPQRNECRVEDSNLSAGPLILQNHQDQNLSPSVASKTNMAILVPRKRVKKVSVAIDATPSSRIVNMFCKHVKDIGGDVSGQAPETTLDLKNDALNDSGNSAPLPSHPPEIETDLNKSTSPAKVCPFPNKALGGEHCETENDVLLQTSSLIPKAEQISSASGNKNHHIYSKRESPKVTHNNWDTLPATSSIKSKLHVEKKDVEITVTPVPLEPEDVKFTSRDSASHVGEELSLLNSLERNHIGNVPGYPSPEQNVVKVNEKQTDCAQEKVSANAVGARRLSLPPHILRPSAKRKETEVRVGREGTERRGHNCKFTRFSRRRRQSTTSRKPSNAIPLLPFKKNESLQESTQAITQTVPPCKTNLHTEEHPLTLVCRHQASKNSTFSAVTPEVHSADNQNKLLRHQLTPIKIRRTETTTETSPPREILIHKKQKSPAKISVGTSTSSLIVSEGTNAGMVRPVETKSDGMTQTDRHKAEGSTSEHKD
jgi:hypothetical protein